MTRLWLALCLALCAAPAAAQCRLALALGLDVSGSVDAREYRLQLDGLAGALLQPAVTEALLALPETPVRLFVFEWSSPQSQRVLIDWSELRSVGDIQSIARRLMATPRASLDLSTGLGRAMIFGDQATQSQDCWRRTLDVSGDGRSNTGPRPREVDASLGDLTVNALVIGTDVDTQAQRPESEVKALRAYFETEVIRGPGAFVEVANGFEAYEDSMARKLLKEVQVLAIGSVADQ